MKNLNSPPSKKSAKFFKKFLPVVLIAGVLIFIFFIASSFLGPGQAIQFIFKGNYPFKSTDDRVNILLLGNAGGIHDGAYLTDTIMVASYNLKTNKAYLISLPRDLWVDSTKLKLNAIYEIGDEKNQGLPFTKNVIEDILGIDVHYAVRLDFRGFVRAIDEIGGIDVSVERSFTDNLYPITGKESDLCGFVEVEKEFNEDMAKKLNIEVGKRKVLIKDDRIATDSAEPNKGYEYFGCRYETVSFKQGLSHMDGDLALKFVRSRMGNNGEGNDFARSKRQQKVIDAFKKKALSFETLTNPTKIKGLIEALGQSIETDLSPSEVLDLVKIIRKGSDTQNFVISATGKNSLLINPPLQDFGGAWVLIPRDGNFDKIHEFVKQIINGEVTEYEATTSARPSDH